jgi:predicted metal-dependent hydrolase
MSVDPELPANKRTATWRGHRCAYKLGYVLTPRETLTMWLQYLRPTYHPRNYGSTSQAVAYLAQSPAARAAQ